MDISKKLREFAQNNLNRAFQSVQQRYAQPQQQQQQSFWNKSNPVANTLLNIQKATPAFQQQGANAFGLKNFINNNRSIADYVPRFQAPQGSNFFSKGAAMIGNIPIEMGANIVGRSVVDPIIDIGSMVGNQAIGKTPPKYNTLKSPLARLGYNAAGVNRTPQQVIGNAAGVITPALDAYGGTFTTNLAKNAFKEGGKQTLKKIAAKSAIEGGAAGSIYGILQGLAEGRNDNPIEQFKKAAQGGVLGGSIGAVGGGVLGGGSFALGKVFSNLKNVLTTKYKMTDQQAADEVKKYARDRLGRFTPDLKTPMVGGGTFENKQPIKLKHWKDLDKELGLPSNFNPQKGGIDLGATIGKGNKAQLRQPKQKGIEQPMGVGDLQTTNPQTLLSNAQGVDAKVNVQGIKTASQEGSGMASSVANVPKIKVKTQAQIQKEVRNTEALSPDRFQSPDMPVQPSSSSQLKASQQPQMEQKQVLTQKLGQESQAAGAISSSKGIISQTVDDLINKTKTKVDDIYTRSLDRFHPLSKIGKEAKQDQAMRSALTGYYGAGSMGKYHTDFELSPVLKSVDAEDLRKYTIAQRDIELAGRDIKGSTQGDANKILEELSQKYGGDVSKLDDAANKLYSYQSKLVKDYLVDTGIMSKEAYAGMLKANQKYVPFKRVMDEVDDYLGVPAKKGAGSVGSQNVIKGIKGSDREVVDPLQSIIDNTYKIVGLGQRQKVAKTIVSLKDSLPEGTIVPLRTAENVKQRIKVLTELKDLFSEKRAIQRNLQTANRGLRRIKTKVNRTEREMESLIDEAQTRASEFESPTVIKNILDKVLTRERKIYLLESDLERGYTAIKAKQLADLIQERKGSISELRGQLTGLRDIGGVNGNTTISVFNDGIKETYQVPPEVAEAAKGLNEESMNTIVKILAYPTRLFRATATGLNPEFAIPNVARDLQSTFINNGLNPLKFVSGLAHYMKKDDVYQEFLKSGGLTSRISLDQKFLKQNVKDLTGQQKALRLTDPRRIKTILEAVGQASEQPTRIASFENAYKNAIKQGKSVEEARSIGAYAAQEGSVNFARRGSQTAGFNAIYAFLNARAQGTDRLIRSAKSDPKGVAFRLGLVTIAPALGLYAHNRNFASYDDERIVPKYEKENNFIIMLSDKPVAALGGAQYIKIPKGEVGKLANPIEEFMKFADGTGGDVQGSLLATLKAFSPISNTGDIIPTALKPAVEDRANYSFFTNRAIVSESKKNYPAKYQSNKSTSAIYKELGAKLNYSPAKIENLVRGYLTGFARIGEMVGKPFEKKDNYSGEDVNQTPVARRFLGGAVRTEEEQQLNDYFKQKGVMDKVQDIKTGIKYGNIPVEDGMNEINKILETNQKELESKPQSNFGVRSSSAAETSSTDPQLQAIQDSMLKLKVENSGNAQKDSQGNIIYVNENGNAATIKLTPPTAGTGIGAFANQNWNITKAREVWSANLPEDVKQDAFKKLGVDPQKVRYDVLANYNNDVKTQYLLSKSPDKQTLIRNILTGREESISGGRFVSDGVVDNLIQQGVLTYAEGGHIKKIGKPAKKSGGRKRARVKVPGFKAIKSTPIKLKKIKFKKVKLGKSKSNKKRIRILE